MNGIIDDTYLDRHQQGIEVKIASRTKRVFALLIDHFFMTSVIVLLVFLFMGPAFADPETLQQSPIALIVAFGASFLLYFAKDCINGVSFGKWVLGIHVREMSDYTKVPSLLRLYLRNLFLILWPVEFIALIINEEKKRIGDKVTSTRVYQNQNKASTSIRLVVSLSMFALVFTSAFVFSAHIMKSSTPYKVATQTIFENYDVREKTGGIKSFGWFPKGSISTSNGRGSAEFTIKVNGNERDLSVYVKMYKPYDGVWEVREMVK